MHGVFPRPEACDAVVLRGAALVEAADVGLHADVAVGVRQEGLDADQHLGDRQRQAPVVVDGVEPHVPVATDVWMEDLCDEADDWRSHWVATT